MRGFADPSEATAGSAADPWGPARRAALADAHAEAEHLLDLARQRSAAAVAAARLGAGEQRQETLEAARHAAEADARRVLSAARRSAHALVLSARREIYAELGRDVTERAFGRREDYEAISSQLIGDARRRLGEHVEIVPAPDGGIIARAPGRQIDYSLPTQVGRCLAQLDDEVRALWS